MLLGAKFGLGHDAIERFEADSVRRDGTGAPIRWAAKALGYAV
jgi:hypothetical protein